MAKNTAKHGELVNPSAMDKTRIASEASEKYLGGRPYRLEDVLERMAGDLVAVHHSFIDLGRCALAVKDVHGHGEFEKIMYERFEEPGIASLRTIRRAMHVAQFAISLGKSDSLSYFNELPKMKQYMLSAATDDDISDDGAIFGISPEDIRALKIKDLEAIIAEQKISLEGKDKALQRGREQNEELREKLSKARASTTFMGAANKECDQVLLRHKHTIGGLLERIVEDCRNDRGMSDYQKNSIHTLFRFFYTQLEDSEKQLRILGILS